MNPLPMEKPDFPFAIDLGEIVDRRSEALVIPAPASVLAAPAAADTAGPEMQAALATAANIPLHVLEDAVRREMQRHEGLVRMASDALQTLRQDARMAEAIRTLNSLDWRAVRNGAHIPIQTLAKMAAIHDAAATRAVAQQAQNNAFLAMSLGAVVAFQLGLGGEGGIGFMDTIFKDGGPVKGMGWIAGRFGLGGDVSASLQFGFSYVKREEFAGPFVGLVLGARFIAGGAITVLFKPYPFQFLGFSFAVGLGLTAVVTAVGGYTWLF
jgi:hypothetical protein